MASVKTLRKILLRICVNLQKFGICLKNSLGASPKAILTAHTLKLTCDQELELICVNFIYFITDSMAIVTI